MRRAVNTPDLNGHYALWQGGMEPNIPVGTEAGVEAAMKRAVAGGEREQRRGRLRQVGGPLEDGAHHAPGLGARSAQDNQLGRQFPPLTYTAAGRQRARRCSRTRRAPFAALATCSASACSTATRSGGASRRQRSSPPTSSATTTSST